MQRSNYSRRYEKIPSLKVAFPSSGSKVLPTKSPADSLCGGFQLSVCFLSLFVICFASLTTAQARKPNVLIAISDDQSYPHASAYGEPVIETPGFDEVARRGMLFHNAFTPAPGCSPMRAAFLTGQYIWQIREAGTHASHFPRDLTTFPLKLEQAGYHTGYTGKPWGPGNYKISGWEQNPAGPSFNQKKLKSPNGISATDYASNFESFLDEQSSEKPFCFWYGGHEPHRKFDPGIGPRAGMNPEAVRVPPFLPDEETVRHDLLDYYYEIQWFDQHLLRMLRILESRGQLEDTLIIVTSDNGMSFPRAKANVYEYGVHMPLAICWPRKIEAGQQTHAIVNLIDVTATIYDVCEVAEPEAVSGHSLLSLLQGQPQHSRSHTLSGRERHSSSRWNSLGYPQRCLRTENYLYIRNFTPERWPAGAPQKFAEVHYGDDGRVLKSRLGVEHGGYHDIDACPTLDFMIQNRQEQSISKYFSWSVDRRPAEEFYAIQSDPGCLINLVGDPSSQAELEKHRQLLHDELVRTGDLREIDFAASHIWETYPRYSSLRWFPEPAWVESGDANVSRQEWLEERRPKADAKQN